MLNRASFTATEPPQVNGFISPYFDHPGLGPESQPLNGFILPLIISSTVTGRPRSRPTAPIVHARGDTINKHPPTFAPPSTFALPPYQPNPFTIQQTTKTTTTTATVLPTFTTTTTTTTVLPTFTTTTTSTTASLPYSSSSTTNEQQPNSVYSNFELAPPSSTVIYIPPVFRDGPVPTSYSSLNDESASFSSKPSLMEVLRSNELTVFAALLTESGLDQMLNQKSYGSFTIFTPNDSAFNRFFEPMGGVVAGIDKLKQNSSELKRVI